MRPTIADKLTIVKLHKARHKLCVRECSVWNSDIFHAILQNTNDAVGKSTFTFLPSKTDKYNGRRKTQDLRCRRFSFICHSVSWAYVLSLVSWVLRLSKSDYSHYLVWTAKPFNKNVLQHFHQEIMTTSITYSIANDYYMHYLSQKSKNLETENWKPKTKDW